MNVKPDLNFYDWIAFHAQHRPDSVAFRSAETGQKLTYAQTNKRINSLATYLKDTLGVKPGDRVMLISRTVFEAFEVEFACARIKAIFTPVNWRLTVAELLGIVEDAQPSVIISQYEFLNSARAISEKHNCPRIIICGDTDKKSIDQVDSYELVVSANINNLSPVSIDWESTWILLYTSGTTGKPKGVMLSYRMMVFNALNFIPVTNLSSETVFLCCMPIFHTGGLSCYANPVLYCGGTIVTMGDFDAQLALDLMSDEDIGLSHMFGVPVMYAMISELQGFKEARFPSLRNAGVGGASATESLVQTWMDKSVPLQPAYGMTEIGPAIAVSNVDRLAGRLRSVGEPVMNMDIRIASSSQEELPPGEPGELQVKGPILMSGYWNAPEKTDAAFYDGWFCTGDTAKLDASGYLYIIDRKKDMYISGGENIYPTEIENALAKHPAVLRVAVVGIPDDKWGEVGRAHIVVRPGMTVTSEELRDHTRNLLASYKVPKYYSFMEQLPQTASGKVKKHELRKIRDN